MNDQPLPAVTTVRVAPSDITASNLACQSAWKPGHDLLLLDPDAEISQDFLAEMQAVLHLHERHAAVSPLAVRETGIFERISPLLPRYSRAPAALPACVLIKAEIIERLGFFDEIFHSFHAALDDFVCRINRRGYSSVTANRTYALFDRQNDPSEPDRDLLLYRYPEYEHKFAFYDNFERDPVEQFAILSAPHRPRILYDLFHLTPSHSGTSDFGLNLLRELWKQADGEFELFVGTHLAERFFMHELAGYRIYDDAARADEMFDLAFKPSQPLSWTELRRLDRLAPRVSFTLLDLIGVRCDYLNSPARQFVLQRAAKLSDYVFALSAFAASDFNAFFAESVPFHTIHLGTNYGRTPDELLPGEHVLVVGNNFAHKGVTEALAYLGTQPDIVVLGGKPEPAASHVRWLASGDVSRQHMRDLFSRARVVVYPSYYEGFGLPVIDALALGKPVIVLDSAVNRELDASFANRNLHRIATLSALPGVLDQLLRTEPTPAPEMRRWPDVAAEYLNAFRMLFRRDWDVGKMRERRAFLRALAASD
ncbi:MAG TPA: glycosyltransferase [Bryobacteraceae bacterium]